MFDLIFHVLHKSDFIVVSGHVCSLVSQNSIALLCYIGDSPRHPSSIMGSFPRRAASPAVIIPVHVQISPLRYFLVSSQSRLFPISFTIANLVGVGARPGEAESLVGPELAENAVASGAEGDGQDEANGEELDGDLLERADALGDGVGCCCCCVSPGVADVLFKVAGTNQSAPPSVMLLALVCHCVGLPSFRSLTGAGDLILGEDWRRRPLTGCWARKTGAARCLSMLKARVDCIVNVCVCERS